MDSRAIASRDRVIAEQRGLLEEQARVIAAQQRLIADLEGRVERLEGRVRASEVGKPRGMPGNKVGPAKPDEPKKERKRRERPFARRRTPEPDARVEHAVAECPECPMTLAHGTVWRTREVIEIAPSPAVVTEHVYIERPLPAVVTAPGAGGDTAHSRGSRAWPSASGASGWGW